jgi:hypothetical protein
MLAIVSIAPHKNDKCTKYSEVITRVKNGRKEKTIENL